MNSYYHGGYPAGGPYSKNETFSGTIGLDASGPITIHIQYTKDLYYCDMTGTIDNAGHRSGTWKDSNMPRGHSQAFLVQQHN